MTDPPGTLIEGHLEPYWEQGWEGNFSYTFVPRIGREEVNGGRGYFLKSGDFLQILDPSEVVIWEGYLHLVPSRLSQLFFRDRHDLGSDVWCDLKQKDVSYSDWVGWFWATPRLQGRFRRN
jgi:hypothetical protein